MARLLFRPAARADLDGIWDYTAVQWGPAQAERYIRAIQAVCEALADGREAGRSAGDIRAGFRKAASGLHMIYYRGGTGGITVVRILHQSMDTGRHL